MPFEAINIGSIANDGSGDWPRDVGGKLNRMMLELYTKTLKIGYKPVAADIADATPAGRSMLLAPDAATQRQLLDLLTVSNLNDLLDVAMSGAALGHELRYNGIAWENRQRTTPQFEQGAGALAIVRGVHQGGTITLTNVSSTISFDAALQGDGFAFNVRNRRGTNWTVPAFANGTLEFEENAAHTSVLSARSAHFEVYSRGGTRYVCVTGATVA